MLVCYLLIILTPYMETAKLPKFKWNELSEQNSGHTPNEWGEKKKESIPKTFVSYTVSWDV